MTTIDDNVVIYGSHANSRAAADNFLPKSGSWRRRIFDFLSTQGINGATDQEMQKYFDKSGDTIRPSRKSLQQDGFIVDSGRVRKNETGNDCTIWITRDYEGMLF